MRRLNWIVAVLAVAAGALASGFAQSISTNLSVPAHLAKEAREFVGETNTISGIVAQVTIRQKLAYLNLDKPYPDMSCSGVIFASRTNQFGNLQSLEGRTVLITGKITLYNDRPEIIIDSTNQLVVLPGPAQPIADSASRVETAANATPPVTASVRPPGDAPMSTRADQANSSIAVWCIVGALLAITALLAWLVVMLRRSVLGAPTALLPPSPPAALQIGPGPAAGGAPGAAPHLLTAETLAGPQAQALRERMAAELTEFAKQSLVQGLYSQRSQLIEAQQKARQELAELEARLASLHLPLQERIRAYETRIAELEKQLETRDGEMREMIRATLLLIRERLEKEKAGGFDVPRFN